MVPTKAELMGELVLTWRKLSAEKPLEDQMTLRYLPYMVVTITQPEKTLAPAFLLISRTRLRLAKGLPFYRELDDHSAYVLAYPFLVCCHR